MKDEIFELSDSSQFNFETIEKQIEVLLNQVKKEYDIPKDAKIESFKIDWLKKCRKVCVRWNGRRFCICI